MLVVKREADPPNQSSNSLESKQQNQQVVEWQRAKKSSCTLTTLAYDIELVAPSSWTHASSCAPILPVWRYFWFWVSFAVNASWIGAFIPRVFALPKLSVAFPIDSFDTGVFPFRSVPPNAVDHCERHPQNG
jgi:hypothetical protein